MLRPKNKMLCVLATAIKWGYWLSMLSVMAVLLGLLGMEIYDHWNAWAAAKAAATLIGGLLLLALVVWAIAWAIDYSERC